ncbi:D-alanyl-D-alanine endopeptidase [Shewanella sedimentimangrovi]|uniref:D-alanyl-D-alanine endopeptidase n=1 Tax=Shewanella sedimentimangrovi TaxID=2814293 RepID=A0ABX7R0Y9_9GAMM|nr:D-alanyl-D-alanine endopeptidase [Shewanella sedimentimangrovi]QSX37344.1 D-alanyl-D-alanine endopeptidase [Shewanella sedimentimangrovi]
MKYLTSLAGLLLVCVSLSVSAASKPQLELASGSALAVDLNTNEVLFSSNPDQVLPIASVSKLMTGLVVLDAKLPLDEYLAVDVSQAAIMKNVVSRVRLGSQLKRRDLLALTLMSSENRAATTLAHHYPGGYKAFIAAMNAKAKALGMHSSHFVEPTGLSTSNVSSASDLLLLLREARKHPLLGELSSASNRSVTFRKPKYSLAFYNTNRLVNKKNWDIDLTKTGYTDEAGHCLVMLTKMAKRDVAFVVLDAFGKFTHLADANRLKVWLETGKVSPVPKEAREYKRQRQQARASAN